MLSMLLDIVGMFYENAMLIVLCLLLCLLYSLLPFLEEPWLEEQYGEAYRQYRKQTPRF